MNTAGFINAQSSHRLLIALGAICLVTGSAAGQDPPSTVELPVVIRDFSRDHADFNVIPSDGYGYYAGNVALDLDDDDKPVFTGGGFRAQRLWKDINGHPIAPHLFNLCGFLTPVGGNAGGAASFGLAVDEKLEVKSRSVIDSFDSNLGPYGAEKAGQGALVRVNGPGMKQHADKGKRWWRHGDDDDRAKRWNKGRRYGHSGKPVVEVEHKSTIMGDVMVGPDLDLERSVKTSRESTITGAVEHLEAAVEMPELAPPELGPSVGEVQYKRGQHTLSEDLHCEELKLKKRAILNIEGDVTIFCDEKLQLQDRSEIRLMDDSTLTLHVGEKVQLKRASKINMNTGNPQLVSIYMLGLNDDDEDDSDSKVDLDRHSQMVAWVQGADAYLKLDDGSQFYGAFMGKKVKVDDGSRLHVDMAAGSGRGTVVYEPEECEQGDVAGTIAVISDGDVLSAGTFSEWWRDVLGVNMVTVQSITMTRNRFGDYFFLHDNYRPIDGDLLGNEGDVHNYHFTLELDTSFTYDAAAGQYFEVRCTDDAYLFINGRMVIDLGGYGFNKVQYVDLDRLGLPDDKPARLQLFHAQRQRGLAIFRLRTNIVLADNSGSPSVNAILED
ncbi:MAG: fibro-slime domain-containing protein [Planctomycetota bacterium]|jgi:fibro-slime domain-containing protein